MTTTSSAWAKKSSGFKKIVWERERERKHSGLLPEGNLNGQGGEYLERDAHKASG